MIRRRLLLAAVACAGVITAQWAVAGSMRCGQHIIHDSGRHGPGKYELLKKCGEPTERFGNTWVYDRSGNRYVVRFEDTGRIRTIGR